MLHCSSISHNAHNVCKRTNFFVPPFTASAIPTSNSASSSVLTQPYYPPSANCWEFKVPVTITSENLVFGFPDWKDDYALQDFLTTVTTRDGPGVSNSNPIVGTKNQTANYVIAASFCTPKVTRKRTIILATHGIGQARTHWNSPYKPEQYNFVQHAINKGYSVWFYDRLGNGESEIASGFTTQLRIHNAILISLAKLVKSVQYTGTFGTPDKLSVMGFSFGSYITHFAVAENPDIADAVVLTAINYNVTALNAKGLVRSFVPRLASLQSPSRFGLLDPGYFKYGFYDLPTISYCEEKKNSFSIAEFLTLTDGDFDASRFTGAALAITGKNDYIICDGECEGIFEHPAREIWKNANFTPYLHPNSSHNLNFHFNATGAFNVITDFLVENKL